MKYYPKTILVLEQNQEKAKKLTQAINLHNTYLGRNLMVVVKTNDIEAANYLNTDAYKNGHPEIIVFGEGFENIEEKVKQDIHLETHTIGFQGNGSYNNDAKDHQDLMDYLTPTITTKKSSIHQIADSRMVMNYRLQQHAKEVYQDFNANQSTPLRMPNNSPHFEDMLYA